MLQVVVPEREFFDEANQIFLNTKRETFHIEHSLVSLSKWESKWNVPFLDKTQKTTEQAIDYVRCMTITQNVNPEVYKCLTRQNLDEISNYIEAPMTATWFNDKSERQSNKEIITAEIIYYWMIAHNIPMECQKWHLNRLLTLIRVCSAKNAPAKKMNRREMLDQRRALNESRRKQINSKG